MLEVGVRVPVIAARNFVLARESFAHKTRDIYILQVFLAFSSDVDIKAITI